MQPKSDLSRKPTKFKDFQEEKLKREIVGNLPLLSTTNKSTIETLPQLVVELPALPSGKKELAPMEFDSPNISPNISPKMSPNLGRRVSTFTQFKKEQGSKSPNLLAQEKLVVPSLVDTKTISFQLDKTETEKSGLQREPTFQREPVKREGPLTRDPSLQRESSQKESVLQRDQSKRLIRDSSRRVEDRPLLMKEKTRKKVPIVKPPVWEGTMYQKWRLATAGMLFGMRLMSRLVVVAEFERKYVTEPKLASTNVMDEFKGNLSTAVDVKFSKRLIELLQSKTLQNIDTIEQMLRHRNKAFASYSLDQRLKMVNVMTFERHPPEKLICKEGHMATSFYFVLAGKVEVFSINNGIKQRMNVIGGGESFGRLAILGDTRLASVATMMETELLCIHKGDYHKVDENNDPTLLEKQLLYLAGFEPFSTYPDFLEHVNQEAKIRIFDTNDVILTEEDNHSHVCIILQGGAKAQKNLKFVQKKITHVWNRFDPDVPLQKDEELIEKEVDIQEFVPRDHFPGLPITILDAAEMETLPDEIMGQLKTGCNYRVISTTKTKICVIKTLDLVKHAPEQLLNEFLGGNNLYQPNTLALQDSVLDRRKWEQYKKGVLHETKREIKHQAL